MQEIRMEMEEKRPQLKGEFSTYRYDIRKRDAIVGYLDVAITVLIILTSDFSVSGFFEPGFWIGIGLVVLTAAVAMENHCWQKRLSVPLLLMWQK